MEIDDKKGIDPSQDRTRDQNLLVRQISTKISI